MVASKRVNKQIRMVVQIAGHGAIELLDSGFYPGLILCVPLDLARDRVLEADAHGPFLNLADVFVKTPAMYQI